MRRTLPVVVGSFRRRVAHNLQRRCNRVSGSFVRRGGRVDPDRSHPHDRTGKGGSASWIAPSDRRGCGRWPAARRPRWRSSRSPSWCSRCPLGVAVQGLVLGLLGAMVAVGMALVYRANRILNFAQGELGTRADRAGRVARRVQRVELLPVPQHRDRGRARARQPRRAGHHPALLQRPPPDPDRRHDRPGPAAGARCGCDPADLGQAADHEPRPRPRSRCTSRSSRSCSRPITSSR